MDYYQISKETVGLIYQAYESLKHSPLDQTLRILVELCVSHTNGCAYCIQIHTREAQEHGIAQEKIDGLPYWQSTDQYSEAERAAFEWCELVTEVDHKANYSKLSPYFTEREIVELTTTISLINTLNRLAIFLK